MCVNETILFFSIERRACLCEGRATKTYASAVRGVDDLFLRGCFYENGRRLSVDFQMLIKLLTSSFAIRRVWSLRSNYEFRSSKDLRPRRTRTTCGIDTFRM